MNAIFRKTLFATALAAGWLSAPAFAAPPGPPPACAQADIPDVLMFDCSGFVEHNLINTASKPDAIPLLNAVGFPTTTGDWMELAGVGGTTLTFTNLMVGQTVIGFHVGGGSDGNFKESTAFYRFDAGAGTHTVNTRFTSLSNGALYSTSPVPEPATYGMVLAGLGLLGAMRRRNAG